MLAKERSEVLKKLENEEKSNHIKTSPKTRALIQNSGMDPDENQNESDIEHRLTACSLHQIANDIDEQNIRSDSKTTNDYLCLN
eukprot:UN12680